MATGTLGVCYHGGTRWPPVAGGGGEFFVPEVRVEHVKEAAGVLRELFRAGVLALRIHEHQILVGGRGHRDPLSGPVGVSNGLSSSVLPPTS